MDKKEIIEKLKKIITENFKIKITQELTGSEKLLEDIGLDSIMLLQIFVYLEEELDILIPEEEIHPNNLITLNNLIDFVQGLNCVKK